MVYDAPAEDESDFTILLLIGATVCNLALVLRNGKVNSMAGSRQEWGFELVKNNESTLNLESMIAWGQN